MLYHVPFREVMKALCVDGGKTSVPLFSIKYPISGVKASLSPLIDVFVTNAELSYRLGKTAGRTLYKKNIDS